jgi:hypothetical protein
MKSFLTLAGTCFGHVIENLNISLPPVNDTLAKAKSSAGTSISDGYPRGKIL